MSESVKGEATERCYSVHVKSTFFDETERRAEVLITARAEGEAAYLFWKDAISTGATGKLRTVEIVAIVPT